MERIMEKAFTFVSKPAQAGVLLHTRIVKPQKLPFSFREFGVGGCVLLIAKRDSLGDQGLDRL